MALDAATLALVAAELNETLVGARIDKIFQPTRDEVLLLLRSRTGNAKLLISARSGSARIGLTSESFENPQTPPSFCMLLRKYLTGGKLEIFNVFHTIKSLKLVLICLSQCLQTVCILVSPDRCGCK